MWLTSSGIRRKDKFPTNYSLRRQFVLIRREFVLLTSSRRIRAKLATKALICWEFVLSTISRRTMAIQTNVGREFVERMIRRIRAFVANLALIRSSYRRTLGELRLNWPLTPHFVRSSSKPALETPNPKPKTYKP